MTPLQQRIMRARPFLLVGCSLIVVVTAVALVFSDALGVSERSSLIELLISQIVCVGVLATFPLLIKGKQNRR